MWHFASRTSRFPDDNLNHRPQHLAEFERKSGKDNVNEGPAYEYDKYLSDIEKNYKNYWKSVTNFADVLHNKGFEKESKIIERSYIKDVKMGFSKLLEKIVRKLM